MTLSPLATMSTEQLNRYSMVEAREGVGLLAIFGPEGFAIQPYGWVQRFAAESYAVRSDGSVLAHRWTIPANQDEEASVLAKLLTPAMAWFRYIVPTSLGRDDGLVLRPWEEWTDLVSSSPDQGVIPFSAHRSVFGDDLLYFAKDATHNYALKAACEMALAPRGKPFTTESLHRETEEKTHE